MVIIRPYIYIYDKRPIHLHTCRTLYFHIVNIIIITTDSRKYIISCSECRNVFIISYTYMYIYTESRHTYQLMISGEGVYIAKHI